MLRGNPKMVRNRIQGGQITLGALCYCSVPRDTAVSMIGRLLLTPHYPSHNRLIVLFFTDPDAPSRHDPKFREWHHWLVVNIPGCDVSKGEVKLEYVGSGPPKGTKLHRYIFLAYKQPGKISYTDQLMCSK